MVTSSLRIAAQILHRKHGARSNALRWQRPQVDGSIVSTNQPETQGVRAADEVTKSGKGVRNR